MKKVLLLLITSAILVFSAICVSASEPADYKPEKDKYTIVYSVGTENAAGMYGMVAIVGADPDTIIDTSNLENIYYIDQASADSDGNITFADFAPKGVAPSSDDYVECTVYIGGPGFDTAEKIGYLRKGEAIQYLLGDIDGNGSVNLDDAVALFQHSMLPDIFVISYTGNIDFDKNGSVNLDDAVRLFQYSMLPDVFPLE